MPTSRITIEHEDGFDPLAFANTLQSDLSVRSAVAETPWRRQWVITAEGIGDAPEPSEVKDQIADRFPEIRRLYEIDPSGLSFEDMVRHIAGPGGGSGRDPQSAHASHPGSNDAGGRYRQTPAAAEVRSDLEDKVTIVQTAVRAEILERWRELIAAVTQQAKAAMAPQAEQHAELVAAIRGLEAKLDAKLEPQEPSDLSGWVPRYEAQEALDVATEVRHRAERQRDQVIANLNRLRREHSTLVTALLARGVIAFAQQDSDGEPAGWTVQVKADDALEELKAQHELLLEALGHADITVEWIGGDGVMIDNSAAARQWTHYGRPSGDRVFATRERTIVATGLTMHDAAQAIVDAAEQSATANMAATAEEEAEATSDG